MRCIDPLDSDRVTSDVGVPSIGLDLVVFCSILILIFMLVQACGPKSKQLNHAECVSLIWKHCDWMNCG